MDSINIDDEKLEEYWIPDYKQIDDNLVTEKIVQSAVLLEDRRKVHVFCQRSLQELTGARVQIDGIMTKETIDAINFTTRSGLSKQLRMTIAHYAANYVQINVGRNEYGNYLKNLFK